MSVRNAGSSIREARLKAGLSQEKLSDGICSVLSLSRIENGTSGVSPSTFQALMAHAGAPCEAFPVFANRSDFECFYALKTARFYLDCWQLNEAYFELNIIEKMDFAQNKYYYQEWLLLHCKLQFRSGCSNHQETFNTLSYALNISRPNINLLDFRELLLSINEIELLILIAQEALYMNKPDICLAVCTQISSYLKNSQITFGEKDLLLAENAIVYSKYLLSIKDYSTALKLADYFRQLMIKNTNDSSLHELTFLSGLGHLYVGNTNQALKHFKVAFFSAHSIGNCYATTIKNYLHKNLNISIFESNLEIEDIPLISYLPKKAIDTINFSDGTYDLFSSDTLTLGNLIRDLRIEQKISQQRLCLGLCSKSKLSKIENGTLQPDVTLAQSFLQRLGISDSVFTFFGNKHESALQELRLKLSHTPLSNTDKINKLTTELKSLCTSKDSFYLQYAAYRKANIISNPEDCVNALYSSLELTIPNFNFNKLHSYSLSWLELTILNNYCKKTCALSPSKGTLYLYSLLNFYEESSLDILEKKRAFSIALCNLSSVLYEQKRFDELAELNHHFSSIALRCSLSAMGVVLANYAQALGELDFKGSFPLFANYAYSNLLITNSQKNADLLKQNLYDDFKFVLF